MKLGDIMKAILIFIVFGSLFFSQMFSIGLQKVKDDWPKNKCNPVYMPFASYLGFDTMKNFTECIGNSCLKIYGSVIRGVSDAVSVKESKVGGQRYQQQQNQT